MAQPLIEPDQLRTDTVAGVGIYLPAGACLPYAGSSAPDGFLLCDGASYAVADYPDLFSVIGYTYGGGGANFNVPDMQGRTPVGVDGGTFASEGTTVGAETHTLISDEMPQHSHTASTTSTGTHTHGGSALSAGAHTHDLRVNLRDIDGSGSEGDGSVRTSDGFSSGYISTEGAHVHSLSINTTGSGHSHTISVSLAGMGDPHNNIQPSLSLNYIISLGAD